MTTNSERLRARLEAATPADLIAHAPTDLRLALGA